MVPIKEPNGHDLWFVNQMVLRNKNVPIDQMIPIDQMVPIWEPNGPD